MDNELQNNSYHWVALGYENLLQKKISNTIDFINEQRKESCPQISRNEFLHLSLLCNVISKDVLLCDLISSLIEMSAFNAEKLTSKMEDLCLNHFNFTADHYFEACKQIKKLLKNQKLPHFPKYFLSLVESLHKTKFTESKMTLEDELESVVYRLTTKLQHCQVDPKLIENCNNDINSIMMVYADERRGIDFMKEHSHNK